MKNIKVSIFCVASILLTALSAQATVNPGVFTEGASRALAQACGGAPLLKRITDGSKYFNVVPDTLGPEAAESAIRQVQQELSAELVDIEKTSVCQSGKPQLDRLMKAQKSLHRLKAEVSRAKPAEISAIRQQILGESVRYRDANNAIVTALKQHVDYISSCKPRVVRCDVTRPDGSRDWTYPKADGRCEPDHRGGDVQAVLAIPGDLREVTKRCR
jgi:hypothetical protein